MSEESIERRNKNLKPFRKAETLTEEERERQLEIQRKGAMARTEKQRSQKTLKEQTLVLLKTEISRTQAERMIGKEQADLIADEDLTVQSVLNVRLMSALLEDGNAKAYELLRDTSGQRPKDEVNITADIMTEADKALIEKINARMGISGDP